MSGRLKLAIFDCDGTLVDSQSMIVTSMVRAFDAEGLRPPQAADVRHVVGLSLAEAIAQLAPGDMDAGGIDQIAANYRKAFFDIRAEGAEVETLYAGIVEALQAFVADDWLLAIATGKSRRGLKSVLENHGLSGHFVTLRTADDGPGKPDPTMIHEILAETGAGAMDTVMIGDTIYDIEMARAARVFALGVDWGYHARSLLEEAGAHAIVGERGALFAASAALVEGREVQKS